MSAPDTRIGEKRIAREPSAFAAHMIASVERSDRRRGIVGDCFDAAQKEGGTPEEIQARAIALSALALDMTEAAIYGDDIDRDVEPPCVRI
jgi:hypothetical protein